MGGRAPVFSCGGWEVKVLNRDMVRLTLRNVEPPIDMVWYADHTIDVEELARHLSALDAMLARGELSVCVNDTFYELALTDGEWRLRAKGAFNFELMGLDTQRAARIALLLLYAKEDDPMESDFERAVRLMGLFSLLESVNEMRLSCPSFEVVVIRHDDKLVLRPIRASSPSEFRTMLSLAEAGIAEGRELEVGPEAAEVIDELTMSMLLGKFDEEFLDEKVLKPVRKELARLVVEHVPHEGEVAISDEEVIVENAYGTWRVDLEDGDLHLNDRYICAEVEAPALDVVVLPGVGKLELGKVSTAVVAALMVALRPEDVRDRGLRKEIEKAASSGEDMAEELI